MTNDSDYGLTSSTYTRDLNVALRASREIRFRETYINRENLEAILGFHARWRKMGIGRADDEHGLYEFLQTHVRLPAGALMILLVGQQDRLR